MTNNIDYAIESLHFEVEKGGSTTIWFDLSGGRFPEAEAMTDMYVGFDDFLAYLKLCEPTLHSELNLDQKRPVRQDRIVESLNNRNFNWDSHLRTFLNEHFDLDSAAEQRQGWLRERRTREISPGESAPKPLAEDATPATWEDLKHAFLTNLNLAATRTFPELRQAGPQTSGRMLEIFDAYSERLSNEIFLLAQKDTSD